MPLTAEHRILAIAKSSSQNHKIGDAACTYAAQTSCPRSCTFFNGGGCYAENGLLYSGLTRPLNGAAELEHATRVDVALAEADAIDAMKVVPGRPMRLHTVGDCSSDETALIVSAAAARYVHRGGGPVWTYTHAWATVDRQSWGDVSVLASCESPEQVELARARGYATSIVVSDFEDRRLYTLSGLGRRNPVSGSGRVPDAAPDDTMPSSLSVLPCPAQTRDDVACSSCRLCMNDQGLRDRCYSIGFAVHGTALTTKKALASLSSPSDPTRRLTSRDHALAHHQEHGCWPAPSRLQKLAGVSKASATEMLARLRAEHHTQGGARV